MGNTCTPKPFSNSQIFKDQNTIIDTIRSASTQQILIWIHQYQQINAITLYTHFLKDITAKYNQAWKKISEHANETINKQANQNHTEIVNYHMNQMSKYILFSIQLQKIVKNQYQNSRELLKQKNKQWKKDFKELLQQKKQKKKKIKSQIFMDQKMNDSQAQKFRKTSDLKGLQKFKQCKQKIYESFQQSPDLQQDQLKDVVMCQTNKMEDILSQHKKQIDILNQRIQKLNCQAKSKLKCSNQKFEDLSQKIFERDKSIQSLKCKISQLETKIKYYEQWSQKNQSLSQQYGINHSFRSTKEKEKNKVQKIQENILQADIFLQNEQEKKLHKASFSSSIQFKKFSDSSVLFANNDYHLGKKYRQKIQKIFEPIQIKQSIMKFKYDQVRPNNMNIYIKDQQNLLLLCLLKNGTILGAFSRFGFKQKQEKLMTNICFIFSIRQDEYYKLQLKQQGMAKYSAKLDNDYLKIGSNQIRITCGTNQGYSSINCSSSIFTCKDKKISMQQFLGSKQDKFEIKSYEIHEIQCQYPPQLIQNAEKVFRSQII